MQIGHEIDPERPYGFADRLLRIARWVDANRIMPALSALLRGENLTLGELTDFLVWVDETFGLSRRRVDDVVEFYGEYKSGDFRRSQN